jgi:hypothetical protein
VGETVTLTPQAKYGATTFVPGAVILAHGRTFDTTPDAFSKYQIAIRLVPSGQALRVNQVGTDHALFSLNVASMDGVTGIHLQGFGINETVPLTGSATPAPAKPTITATGAYSSLQFPVSQSFSGVIEFGPLVSIIRLGLIGSDFGSIADWIVRFEGPEVTVEVLAHAVSVSQAHPPYLNFDPGLGRLPSGQYLVSARAVDNPAIASNVVSVQVQ